MGNSTALLVVTLFAIGSFVPAAGLWAFIARPDKPWGRWLLVASTVLVAGAVLLFGTVRELVWVS